MTIQERIAEIIRQNFGCLGASYCSGTSDELASALVSELGLHEERFDWTKCGASGKSQYWRGVDHRYVTDWERADTPSEPSEQQP